jgi:hypothetical protein
MIPPSRKLEYEKIKTDDFVTGEVKEIKYDLEHKFTYQGNTKIAPACRIAFRVDGYKYDHGTPWMSFNLDEKSNLYKKYVSPLVVGAEPYMEFDLDNLIGMKVKMLWADKGDFQHIETIRPIGEKVSPSQVKKVVEDLADAIETDDETVPF